MGGSRTNVHWKAVKMSDYIEELINLLYNMEDLAKNWQENHYELQQMREKTKNIVRKGIYEQIKEFLPDYSLRIEGELEFRPYFGYFDTKTGRWMPEDQVQFKNDLWVSHIFKGQGKYKWINKLLITRTFNESNITARTDPSLIRYAEIVNKIIVDEIDQLRLLLQKEFGSDHNNGG